MAQQRFEAWGALAALVIAGIIGVWFWNAMDSDDEASARVLNFSPAGSTRLRVSVEFTNDSDETVTGECTLTAFNQFGEGVGFDVAELEVGPESSDTMQGFMVIEDEGAKQVADVECS